MRETSPDLVFLTSGAMGRRIAEQDWSDHSLGPISGWPAAMRTALSMVLNSGFPSYIAWGPQFHVFYNEAYAPVLGDKLAAGQGLALGELWSEIRETACAIAERAYAGESTYFSDMGFVIERHGHPEQAYFTFSYSPIRDEFGAIGGLLGIVFETTDKVVALERHRRTEDGMRTLAARQAFLLRLSDRIGQLDSVDEIIAAASAMLGRQLGLARALYGEVAGDTVSVRCDWTAPGFASLAGQTWMMAEFGAAVAADLRAATLIVNNDVARDPRTAGVAAAYRAIGVRAALLVPLVRSNTLRLVLALHRDEPCEWTDEDIALAGETAERTWLAAEAARARAELRTERDRSQSIFDSMTEGFTLLDSDWTILEVNEIGARMAQREQAALVGRNQWTATPELVGTEIEALYRRVRASGCAETVEYHYGAPSGKRSWIEIRVYPLAAGRLAIFYRDVTERKKIAQELSDANRRKDEFLAMLAHELRNPLAPIRAAADVLSIASLDEERIKKTSAVISRQVRHMTSLVDDLLDVSRVTRGLVTLDMLTLDAKRIVSDAVEQVRPLIEARAHRFAVHLPPEPATVRGDQKRLVQVLTNLLNNAAKYTPEGGSIVLRLEVSGDEVVLTVSDTGIGMSADMSERAFELFAQAERSADRAQGGLGLGLALVKSLVLLHGGEVGAHSDGDGHGSRFTVRLPLAEKAAAPALVEKRLGANPAPHGLRLLIVDDNDDAASMLAMFLEASGHTVSVEHGSRRALERARVEKPEVCLLDIGLPDMDGNELARRLRAQPETRDCVLIAVTGYGQEQDRMNTAAAGFDHHFVKPLEAGKLAALLARLAPR